MSSTESARTLGSVRLHDAETKEIVLVPTPSNNPNDPLNWSKHFRYYIAFLVCLAMVLCNFLAAGPTVAMVETALDFFTDDDDTTYTDEQLDSYISQISYFFTATALMQGLGNLFWMPLILKYGKRPIYLASFVLYTITAVWVGLANTYANALVARIVMGLAAGSAECLAPLTISEVFFLHERGRVMAFYTASLNFGISVGIVLSGLITIDLSWRYIYWVASALIGTLTLVVFFTMPETSFDRTGLNTRTRTPFVTPDAKTMELGHAVQVSPVPKQSFRDSLRVFHGKRISEPFWKLFLRPVVILILPPVLWATLVMAVTIGFLVAITSNFADAFSDTYGFETWQSGLCFVSGFIGSAFGIIFGGTFSDWVADFLTKNNGGIREPEFRLPAIAVGMLTAPLALALYGIGIEHELHWMVPTLGLGLLNFSIAQATNVSLCYIVDSYRPIAGEGVVTQLAFKSAFGFLLSFYTNPWTDFCGYAEAFGEMAGIAAMVLLFWVPFFIFGKQIRAASLNWPVMRAMKWSADREVGE